MSMDGRAIAAGAVSDGGLRRLVTEMAGARPGAIVAGAIAAPTTATTPETDQKTRATRP